MLSKPLFENKLMVFSILYMIVGVSLLARFGIQTGGEAEKYIDNAHRIINGEGLRNGVYGSFYLAYSLVVAFFIKCAIPLFFVGVLQLLLSLVAAVCLYRGLFDATGSRKLSMVFFLCYLLCYPIQKWNFFLYSESLHTSILVIALYSFAGFIKARSAKTALLLVLMLLLVFFSRPAGVVFIFAVLFALLVWLWKTSNKKLFWLLSAAGIASVVIVLNSPLIAFVNPDSIVRLEVICQVSGIDQNKDYLEFQHSGLQAVYKTITEEVGVGRFIWIGLQKITAFFGMYRSYYSLPNNLLLILNWILYPLAIVGIFSRASPLYYYIKLLSVIYLLLMTIVVFFTCDDWANRFVSPVYPFIIILAAIGAWDLYRKMIKPKTDPV